MIPIENQVISLALAKRLKELGVKKKSIFTWGIGGDRCEKEWTVLLTDDDSWSATETYLAFTVAELGDMLPACIQSNLITFLKRNHDHYSSYATFYSDGDRVSFQEHDQKEAGSRAKMLIYLIENGHVKAEDL
jgi:hypothetical protein